MAVADKRIGATAPNFARRLQRREESDGSGLTVSRAAAFAKRAHVYAGSSAAISIDL